MSTTLSFMVLNIFKFAVRYTNAYLIGTKVYTIFYKYAFKLLFFSHSQLIGIKFY